MSDKKKSIWPIIATLFFLLTALFMFGSMWYAMTDRATVRFDCSSTQLEYMTVGSKDICTMYAVHGKERNVCIVPKDFHCTGALEDVPLVRGVVEAAMRG